MQEFRKEIDPCSSKLTNQEKRLMHINTLWLWLRNEVKHTNDSESYIIARPVSLSVTCQGTSDIDKYQQL